MTGGEAVKDNVGSTRKISELSDQDLSRLIAEEIEPIPEVLRFSGFSKVNCWRLAPNIQVTAPEPELEWQPRNFVTDPAMRDLLQEKLLEDGLSVTLYPYPKPVKLIQVVLCKGDVELVRLDATRERLWPEAYALAHGLGEK